MNKNKILEFFDASVIKSKVHIIGCGAIGSHVAEQLARIGVEELDLWDFDKVSPHNITNQMFLDSDIGRSKTEAVFDMVASINPDIKVCTHEQGLTAPYTLSGYVFLCVDNIDLRRTIVQANQYNPSVLALFDFRMRLTDAQHYMARLGHGDEIKTLLATMNFSHEEAKESTPVSACGVELSVVYTVKTIVSLGINNFVRVIQDNKPKTMMLVDLNLLAIDCYPMD